ncbi:MAG: SUMF1/EgtB/PvdO family nonheme iron enzyme [Gemmataceae bacterium]
MDATGTLLEALHAQPNDPTCWLALADALEEDGRAGPAELLRARLARQLDPDDGDAQHRLLALAGGGVRAPVPGVVNSLGMALALVPPGRFWMGSPEGEPGRHPDEHPRHRVRLTRAFYLGVCPVTQEQFRAVTRHNPSHFRPGGEGGTLVAGLDTRRFPVERVSWFDAAGFCDDLSRLPAERSAGRVYRLPTEAEWEYACRAGTDTVFHFGDALGSDRANIEGNLPEGAASFTYLARPCDVGSYPANAFGLHDMHGNVWEWCADWFDDEYYAVSPPTDPPGPAHAARRSLRGGSWFYGAWICRSAYRYRYEPETRHHDFGLRVAMEAKR